MSDKLEKLYYDLLEEPSIKADMLGFSDSSTAERFLLGSIGVQRIDFLRLDTHGEYFEVVHHEVGSGALEECDASECVKAAGAAKIFGRKARQVIAIFVEDIGGNLEFSIRPDPEWPTSTPYTDIQGHILEGFARLPIGLTAFSFEKYDMRFWPFQEGGIVTFHAEGDRDFNLIRYGDRKLVLKDPYLRIVASGLTTEKLEIEQMVLGGAVTIGKDMTFNVYGNVLVEDFVNGEYVLTGKLEMINMLDLANSLPVEIPQFPVDVFPLIVLLDASFEVRYAGNQLTIVVIKDLSDDVDKDWGTFVGLVTRVRGKWHFAAIHRVKDTWRFELIADELALLDRYNFTDRAVLVSSFGQVDFWLPEVQGLPPKRLNVREGVSFHGTLALDRKPELTLLRDFFRIDRLICEATFQQNFSRANVTARWNERIVLARRQNQYGEEKLQDVIWLTGFVLELILETDGSLTIGAFCDLVMDFKNVPPAPQVYSKFKDGFWTFGVEIGEWKDVIGISGLTIKNLAVQFTPHMNKIEVTGFVKIATQDGGLMDLELGIGFIPQYPPIVLWFFSKETDCFKARLQQLVGDLVKVRLLDHLIPIEVSETTVYIVPHTVEFNHVSYKPGLWLEGKLSFYGYATAKVRFRVDPFSGIELRAELMKMIEIGEALKIGNHDMSRGPLICLTSSSSPFLEMKLSVSFLGVTGLGLSAILTMQGFSFRHYGRVGRELSYLDYDLTFTAKAAPDAMSLPSAAIMGRFTVNFLFETSRANIGGHQCGVSTTIIIGATLEYDTAEDRLTIYAAFSAFGESYKVTKHFDPTTTFRHILNDLVNWARKLIESFLSAFDAIKRWLKNEWDLLVYIWRKTIKFIGELVEQALVCADILFNKFNVGLERTAEYLKKYLDVGAQELAKALKSIEDDLKTIGDNLKRWFNVEGVAKALQNIGHLADFDLAQLLQQVGFSSDAIADGLKKTFSDITGKRIAEVFHDTLGIDNSEEIANILNSVGEPAETIAEALGDIFPSANDVANGAQQVVSDLEDLGRKIGRWHKDSKDPKPPAYVAKGLRSVGADIFFIRDFLKNNTELDAEGIRDAIVAAGYSPKASSEIVH